MADAARVTPFPVDALPEPVRSYVLSVARTVPGGVGAAAVLALCAVAGAVGGTRGVRTSATDRCDPAVLWGLVVFLETTPDTPAPDLTPALNRVLDALHSRQQEYAAAYRDAVASYRPAMREWLRKSRRLEQLRKDNPGYRASWSELPMTEPPRPVLTRLITADPSAHALATAMAAEEADRSGRGTLLARGSLDGWVADLFRSATAGDDPTWDRWRACHDGTPPFDLVDRDDDDRSLPVSVVYPALSVIGGASVAALRTPASRTPSAAADPLDFFLPVLCDGASATASIPAVADPREAARFDHVLFRLMDLKRLSVDPEEGDLFDFGPVPVPLAPDAEAAWASLAATDSERHALRLAALLALVRDVAAGETRDAAGGEEDADDERDDTDADIADVDDEAPVPAVHVPTITAGDLAASVELARWFAGQRTRVRDALSRSARDRRRSDLLGHLRTLGGSATVRSLMRAGPCFPTATAARDALDDLARDGQVAWSEPGPRAQPVFRLTPAAGSAP